jgi:hypothetical protein
MKRDTLPIGTVRVRTRHKRGGEKRAWIKVAEPNVWRLRAQVVWEEHHGPIPTGMGVHHKDRDKLNDTINNLELLSKAEHLREHYPEYKERIVAKLTTIRRKRRWSTKSKTKRTGRPPTWTETQMKRAVGEWLSSDFPLAAISRKHRVPIDSLRKQIRAVEAAL